MVPHDAELRQGTRKFQIGDKSFNGYEHNKLWQNTGDGKFVEVGFVAGADVIVDSRSCAVADFDRDGRQDIALRTMYERSYFLHNEADAGNFLQIRLVGTKSNRMGVGARVTARTGDVRQTAEMTCGTSFMSHHESAMHSGLGKHERVNLLKVRWPSGTVLKFRDVPANEFITITEGSESVERREPDAPPSPTADAVDPFVKRIREGTYVDLDGRPATVPESDLILVHVWAPSCIGCDKEVVPLNKLQKLSADGRFTILAIAVGAKVEATREFVKQYGVNYPVLIADKETGQALMKIPQVPWSYLARGFGGWFEVGAPSPNIQSIPWSGLVDGAGFQRRYRGPIKYFEAKLDIVTALGKRR